MKDDTVMEIVDSIFGIGKERRILARRTPSAGRFRIRREQDAAAQFLGMTGEDLGRSHSEAKKRPLCIVRDKVGFQTTQHLHFRSDTGLRKQPN